VATMPGTRKRRRGRGDGGEAKSVHSRVAEAYAWPLAEQVKSLAGLLALPDFALDFGRTWRKLGSEDKAALLEMTEVNMAAYYGNEWDDALREKRRDMASLQARYIVVREKGAAGAGAAVDDDAVAGHDAAGGRSGAAAAVAGFLNYRFVIEDEWAVLYVYELQVAEPHRGKGLGKHLLAMAEALARAGQMQGVMLTALKSNAKAMGFYCKSRAYVPSTIDPTHMFPDQAERFNYRILCKMF